MNSAVRRFILFFFSIATLAACEDPTDIGIDLQEDYKIGTDYTDTLTINSGTVLLNDSILSFKKTPALIGSVIDPVLGKVTATHFTEVNLGGVNVKFGDNPVADSLMLTLDYNFLYGEPNNAITIKVYELEEGFQEKATYFTNSELAHKSTLLGSTTLVPRIHARDIDGTGNAATVDSASLIKIKLDPAFMQKIVAESGKDALKTQKNFTNFLKGLALVVEGNTNGKLVGINVNQNAQIKSNQTALKLYYKNGTESKTHTFMLNGSEVRSFSKITADRSGTALANLQEKGQYLSAEQTSGESYVQAGTQLFTKISIPFLKELKAKHGDFIINRAELVIPVKAGSTTTYTPPQTLVMYETNSTNRILIDTNGLPKSVQKDFTGSVNTNLYPTAMVYDSKKNQYSVNITSYVQAILTDAKPNSSLLLAPATLATGATGTSQIIPEILPYRAILSNTEANGMKLRVYFSKLN